MKTALEGLKANPPVEEWEITELFKDADKNGDGCVDVDGKSMSIEVKTKPISFLYPVK